jgi:hypothetical protein
MFDLLAAIESHNTALTIEEVAVSAEVSEQMRVLASILVDVFLERRSLALAARSDGREGQPSAQWTLK